MPSTIVPTYFRQQVSLTPKHTEQAARYGGILQEKANRVSIPGDGHVLMLGHCDKHKETERKKEKKMCGAKER